MHLHDHCRSGGVRSGARGLTLVELTVGLGIASLALASIALTLHGDAADLDERPASSFQEQALHDMFGAVALELDDAVFAPAVTELEAPLSIVESEWVHVADASLFPATGALIVSPGRANEERLLYADLDPSTGRARIVQRGFRATEPAAHARGARVAWSSAAASDRESGHRGDGSGLSFRPASDPGGAAGHGLAGACLYFEPVAVITEEARGFDYNGDGDLDDTFDVGRLRSRRWTPDSPAALDRPLSPPIVLQERGARGVDLDGDGREDPIFEWDRGFVRVRVRAIVGAATARDVVLGLETGFRLAARAAD